MESGIDDLHIIYAVAKIIFDIKFKPRSVRGNCIKKWRVKSGEWRVESGEWRVECGEWN